MAVMTEPKITVIIPTRERCETLGASIRTCVEQDYDNLDIIVSDNASRDDTEAVVRSFTDPRLRYIRTGRRLSMTSNFEFALGHARSGFVAFIGDDDGLMPRAIARVSDLIKQTGTKAIVSYSVDYGWPNHPFENVRNRMYIRKLGRNAEVRKSGDDVERLLAFIHGKDRADYWELPTLYRGFIATDVIQAVRREGRYFHSMTPDVYAAFANSFIMESFVRLDQPLTIEGVSGRSNGASLSYGINNAEEKRFIEENDLAFHPDLVYAPSIHIIIAEAYLQARSRFPDACESHDFRIARICGTALRDASGPNRDRIIQAVADTLAKHGLAEADRGPPPSALHTAWQRFVGAYSSDEVNCELFGARDVYQASVLADHLLTLHYEGRMRSGASRVLRKLRKKFGYS